MDKNIEITEKAQIHIAKTKLQNKGGKRKI